MECEICYESYNNEERTPLILACKCRKFMCLSCVTRRLDSTARCPYCDIRWSVRNYIAQCKDITPHDTLENLQRTQQSAESSAESSHSEKLYALGSGELRMYYEKSVQDILRKAEEKSADQIDEDKKIAKILQDKLHKEAEDEKISMKEMEEKDAAYAAKINSTSSSSSYFQSQKDKNLQDYKNKIDRFVNVRSKSDGPLSSSSSSSFPSFSTSSSSQSIQNPDESLKSLHAGRDNDNNSDSSSSRPIPHSSSSSSSSSRLIPHSTSTSSSSSRPITHSSSSSNSSNNHNNPSSYNTNAATKKKSASFRDSSSNTDILNFFGKRQSKNNENNDYHENNDYGDKNGKGEINEWEVWIDEVDNSHSNWQESRKSAKLDDYSGRNNNDIIEVD